MPLLYILLVIIIVVVLLWGVGRIPMDSTVRSILTTIVIVALCLWLVSVVFNLGILGLRP